MQKLSQVMKDTSNELDRAGSNVDKSEMREDIAIVEGLQVTF